MSQRPDTFTLGILTAWVTVVAVSAVVGVIYTIDSAGGLESLKLADAGSAIFLVSLMFTCVSAASGLIATLALGIPILKLFIGTGIYKLERVACSGMLTSVVLAAALYAGHSFGDFLTGGDFTFSMLAVFISGPLAGLSFWAIYRRGIIRRPYYFPVLGQL